MSTSIRVSLGERSYDILTAPSYAALPPALARLGLPRWACVVSHPALLDRFGAGLLGPLRRAGWDVKTITVPESERSKSYAMAERVLQQLARLAVMQEPLLLAFGGGVVGDLTGFVASVFRRGVPYVQLPTTLLAQVDSAIGGKVGVDLSFAKNFVGTFYQPRLVVNHLGVLRSLPLRQRRSGLGEVIKYGVMADRELFRYVETHAGKCVEGRPAALRVIVPRCCRIKARVVSQDERETRGLRTHLNFGHTLGHAIETATGYRRFTHGEAIAVGMVAASRISVEMGLMPPADASRVEALLRATGLPTRAAGVSWPAAARAMRFDKKFLHGRMRWVLSRGIGRVVVRQDVPPALVERVSRSCLTGLGRP